MEETSQIKISLITDNLSLRDTLLAVCGRDYALQSYSSQEETITALENDPPELILTDLSAANSSGLETCKNIRRVLLLRHIPIILILPDSDAQDKEKLIYSGCDDYLQISEIESELLVKIKLNLFRIARQQDINPLTKLPGQASLLKELQKRISSKGLFALHYADLYKIREFNQRYGFKKGDEIIRYTGGLILKTLKTLGSPSDFLSHPQNDDFIYLTLADSVNPVAEAITKEFDKNIPSFYDPEDVQRGHTLIKNRKGDVLKIPFLRIYIGIVTNEYYAFTNPGQLIQVATELRSFAQNSFQKSFYVKDRRKSYTFR